MNFQKKRRENTWFNPSVVLNMSLQSIVRQSGVTRMTYYILINSYEVKKKKKSTHELFNKVRSKMYI